jgi:Ser/Thr protein kinase RdoA (MazF antagonist)
MGRVFGFRPLACELICAGYQDLNLKVTTHDGNHYLLKVFSKTRTLENVRDQLLVLERLKEAGLPVPRLLAVSNSHESLVLIQSATGPAYACMQEFFDGTSFAGSSPLAEDISHLAGLLARMHRLDLTVLRFYDDWGAVNVVLEFEKKRHLLSGDDLDGVAEVVARHRLLDLSGFHHCAIHGDLYRSHVLKDVSGSYCLIDFGCLDFNAAVVDLAIFIAHFCLDGSEDAGQRRRIYELAIDSYAKIRPISDRERESIPVLIASSYASYLIATTSLIATQQDDSDQTRAWLAIARSKLLSFLKSDLFVS